MKAKEPEGKAQQDPQTFAVIGAAMEVHRTLGCGFLEAVYQEALALKMAAREIQFRQQPVFDVGYKGRCLGAKYAPDFLVEGEVIVEIKAISKLGPVEAAQVINYLKVTGLRLALLLNFGGPSQQVKRFAL